MDEATHKKYLAKVFADIEKMDAKIERIIKRKYGKKEDSEEDEQGSYEGIRSNEP